MKKRIDVLVSQKLEISRSRAQELIIEGCVYAGAVKITKPSAAVEEDCQLAFIDKKNYVSRGAYKLLGAIEKFCIDFDGLVVLDMGASTGGFTQVALENGAKKVYSVDIGKNELDKSLACHQRVVNMNGRDIRSLKKEEVCDAQIVVGDLSFISLRSILPKIKELFDKIECILLFKPQFECGKVIAKKFKGVIKDRKIHQELLRDFIKELEIYDYHVSDLAYSPIKGKSGNIEYLFHLNGKDVKKFDLANIVDAAFSNLKN